MKILEYIFSGPYDTNKGFTERISGVYAILDGTNVVIDVGETEDLNNRFPNHPREKCWKTNSIKGYYLYILRDSNKQNRLFIEKRIRNYFKPVCGVF